jgi:hypothetical protein
VRSARRGLARRPLRRFSPQAVAALPALAALLVACGDADGPSDPSAARQFAASGQVHALSGSLPAGLRVIVQAGTVRSSAAVAPNGSFQIQALLPGDSVDVIIDTEGPARSTLPALLRVSSRTPLTGATLVLVPARWTISGGALDGRVVNISMEDAFRAPCATAGDINCDGFFPKVWFSGVKLWAAGALPAPLAFDHPRSHETITAADSAQFWSFASRMDADVGLPLFRPARIDEIGVTANGSPTQGILVRIDTTLTGFGAWTNWWWNASGDMYAGLIRPRTLAHLRVGPLMTHELLHTQGIKHSCSWPTVMSGYGNPCSTSTTLSVYDIAYFQLARAVHERQRATGAQHGLIAALQGERVLLRGLPPWVPAGAALLPLMRADSIGDGDHAH